MVRPFRYPHVHRDLRTADVYHGKTIKDPYRWLENPNSSATERFIKDQNNLTIPYLEECQEREMMRQRLTALWDYPKYSCPFKKGDRYYFFKNTGLQNQRVLYTINSVDDDDEARVFFDPNTLATDGSISLDEMSFSKSGEIFAYSLSTSGSDWVSIHFRNVESGDDYPDELEKAKSTSISWTRDNLGVFYAGYPDFKGDAIGSDTSSNQNQKLFYHHLGTRQSCDTLVVEFPDNPQWMLDTIITHCGNYLLVSVMNGCCDERILYTSLVEHMRRKITSKFELIELFPIAGSYDYIHNQGKDFYFRTNFNAPNYRVIKINLKKHNESAWINIVPEHPENVLDKVACINSDNLVLCYIDDVKSSLKIFSLSTECVIKEFNLEVGTIVELTMCWNEPELFFEFTSFLVPSKIYRANVSRKRITAQLYREVLADHFDASHFRMKQIFYSSEDGTKVPMFIIHKNRLKHDGDTPCLLYGYGGFGSSILPSFMVPFIVFVQNFRGVVAVANIRGGGEYGGQWHENGKILNKQKSYDDFQAAAQYLIDHDYTSSENLVIQGRSNGGLMVGACINQRPDLFAAAIALVGVHDLLRFPRFTIGHAWLTEYGDPSKKNEFDNLLAISPLHNVRMPSNKKCQYPAVLLLTADHDDRVVPLHSYKFISELQHTIGQEPRQTNPLMIRIDTKSGHGAGKPIAKLIEENVEIFSFLAQALDFEFSLN